MDPKTSCFVVDDDPAMSQFMTEILRREGYQVDHSTSSRTALEKIPGIAPNIIFLDIMMPEMDGLELCRKLREIPVLDNSKIIMVTAKSYDFDQRRARMLGANGYIVKPIDVANFNQQVRRVIEDKVCLSYWGVRGTLPVSGRQTVRYGGNTSCVSMKFPNGEFFIFDAGSGIRELGKHLMSQGSQRLSGKFFLSHPHWDHINAFPFFVPFFIPGNEFEIIGPKHGDMEVRDLINDQMNGVYFPITMREFGSHLIFRNMGEEKISFGEIEISTMWLSHPGSCLGYRINYCNRSICYITDNEIYEASNPNRNPEYVDRLVSFLKDADVVITDTCYLDEEYKTKVGWGHCSVSQVIEFTSQANIKALHLFHHDPDQNDDDIDRKLLLAREKMQKTGAKTEILAPAEFDNHYI